MPGDPSTKSTLTTAYLKAKIAKEWLHTPHLVMLRDGLAGMWGLYRATGWRYKGKCAVQFDKQIANGCESYTATGPNGKFEILLPKEDLSYWFIGLNRINILNPMIVRAFQFVEYKDAWIHVFSDAKDTEVLCVHTVID